VPKLNALPSDPGQLAHAVLNNDLPESGSPLTVLSLFT